MEQMQEVIVFYICVKQFEQKSYQHASYKHLNIDIDVLKGLSDTKKTGFYSNNLIIYHKGLEVNSRNTEFTLQNNNNPAESDPVLPFKPTRKSCIGAIM